MWSEVFPVWVGQPDLLAGDMQSKGRKGERAVAETALWSWITSACSNCGFGCFCCIFMTVGLEPLKEYELLLLHVFFMSVCGCFPKRPQWWHPKKVMVLQLQHTSKTDTKTAEFMGCISYYMRGPMLSLFPYPNNVGSWAPFFSNRPRLGGPSVDAGSSIFRCALRTRWGGQLRPNDPAFTFNK